MGRGEERDGEVRVRKGMGREGEVREGDGG